MFLTGKQLRKIRLVTGGYIGIGAVSVFFFLMFLILGSFELPLLIFGIFCLAFSYPVYKICGYSAGKGKLINSGNNLFFSAGAKEYSSSAVFSSFSLSPKAE